MANTKSATPIVRTSGGTSKAVICKVDQVAKNEEQGRHFDKETPENHHKGFSYGDPF